MALVLNINILTDNKQYRQFSGDDQFEIKLKIQATRWIETQGMHPNFHTVLLVDSFCFFNFSSDLDHTHLIV